MDRKLRKATLIAIAAGAAAALTAGAAQAKIVMLNSYTVYDYTIPGDSYVGELQFEHLVYDDAQIDPKTHRVPILNMQHRINGKYVPEHPNAVKESMNGAWLDLSAKPYRYHRWSAVTHGVPIIIDVQENGRINMRKQSDMSLLVSGSYWIDPTPITGPEATAAGTPE